MQGCIRVHVFAIAGTLLACSASTPVASHSAPSEAKTKFVAPWVASKNPWASLERMRSSVDEPRRHVDGPTRPATSAVEHFEYGSIPLASDAPVSGQRGALFRLTQHHAPVAFANAMCIRDRITWTSSLSIGAPAVVRVGDGYLPPAPFFDGTHEDDELQRLVELRKPDGTVGPESVAAHATWALVDTPDATADSADVTLFEGEFRGFGAVARTASRVTARALVPHEVHAFRRCVAGCEAEAPAEPRVEEIAVVTPQALWAASSDVHARSTVFAPDQPFTIVAARVARGSTSALLVHIDQTHLGDFHAPFVASGPLVASFQLEVAWPADGAPEVTLFSGVADGADAALLLEETVHTRPLGDARWPLYCQKQPLCCD